MPNNAPPTLRSTTDRICFAKASTASDNHAVFHGVPARLAAYIIQNHVYRVDVRFSSDHFANVVERMTAGWPRPDERAVARDQSAITRGPFWQLDGKYMTVLAEQEIGNRSSNINFTSRPVPPVLAERAQRVVTGNGKRRRKVA